jgi:hypothetical protein
VLSLDHPGDSLLFDVANRDFAVFTELLSATYNPFSKCMTVLAGGQDSSKLTACSYQGIELEAVSPMPIDIKAMQHVYTHQCSDTPIVFILMVKEV